MERTITDGNGITAPETTINTTAIIKAVTAAGANAHKTIITAGLYYDGTQHGAIAESVNIFIDHLPGIDSKQIEKDTERALKRFKGVHIRRESSPYWTAYIVTSREDRERLNSAAKEGNIFLDAFHNEIHRQNVAGEKQNGNKAITAGHEALKAAGYSVTTAA